MATEESFLRAIRKNPRDAGPRLVYADWLEEHGEACRGELVRVCEAMRGVPVFSDEYWRLKSRRNELRPQCPADWLAATGYDGSRYDCVYRDGIPDDWKGRWRLIREFAERWYGIPMGDVGGRRAEVREAEQRLGRQLPPSIGEYVAYARDVKLEGNPETVQCDTYTMEAMDNDRALSLMIAEWSVHQAVHYDDLGLDDPPVYGYGVPIGDGSESILLDGELWPVVSVSEFVLDFVDRYKPDAGAFGVKFPRTRGMSTPDVGEVNANLAAALPVRVEDRRGVTYEGEGVLARVDPGHHGQCFTLEAWVRPSVQPQRLPKVLWGYARMAQTRSGLFLPRSMRRLDEIFPRPE